MNNENMEKRLEEGNYEFQHDLMTGREEYDLPERVPRYPILIITCMDPRIDMFKIFHLKPGDVFILRNAGNVYSKDILRSILVALIEFQITDIVVLGHIGCGMTRIKGEELLKKCPQGFINVLSFRDKKAFFKTFRDEIQNIKAHVRVLREFPHFPKNIIIKGMLYDITTGYVFSESEWQDKTMEQFRNQYNSLLLKKRTGLMEYLERRGGTQACQEEMISRAKPLEVMRERRRQSQPEYKEYLSALKDEKLLQKQKIIEETIANMTNMQKINVPKIRIPKIKVRVPQIYIRGMQSKEGEET